MSTNKKIKKIISLIPKITQKDKLLIEKAYKFAKKAHKGHLRKSGEPYFIHAYETAKKLAELGMYPVVIAAGFLHDVIRDTKTTEEEVLNEFGEEIVKLIKGVTKLSTIKYKGVEKDVESTRKFFISLVEDMRVLIIRMADRLHNLKTLQFVHPSKQRRIAFETLEVHTVVADRLSMGQLKGELEDCSFKYAYPKEYNEIKKLLFKKRASRKKYLKEVKDIIIDNLKKIHVKNFKVDYRQKHLYSLWKKLQRYNMDISKIYDIIALRIMVDSVADCYHVLGIIHGLWTPVPGRIKDYIAVPKENGYQSIHTTIFTGTGGTVEIQIRTHEMHKKSENGMAAHFVYKEKKLDEQQIRWIKQIQELKMNCENPLAFIEELKISFFKDKVFAFTPNGEIIELPEDSSVIDFAYAIDVDIGNHAQGAKVNGKNVALDTKLKTNDIVLILTNKNSKPSSKWLDYAKTTIARSYIKMYLDTKI